VPAYVSEPEGPGGRRQGTLAVTFLILALATSYLPDAAQQRIAWGMRVTLLRPFLATQERLTDARLRASDVGEMRLQLDSLSSILTTQAALADENRTLRDLLGLAARVTPSFLPATVLRPGTPGSEGMFWVELGTADGIAPGAPVVSRHGLVGVIREVRETISVGMDSTHPDFRASAMLADGSTFGMVQARRGAFREADRLVFDGTPYHESSLDGTVVLTSGLSGVLPRGIPIGRIDGVEEVQGRWLKSYWLRPMVEPGSVTHVLVATRGAGADETELWAADSLFTLEEAIGAGRTP
jgi:rod shape-determining protein MreC